MSAPALQRPLGGLYTYARCPAHGCVVAFFDGKLVGLCDGCATDAAQAQRQLKASAARIDSVLTSQIRTKGLSR